MGDQRKLRAAVKEGIKAGKYTQEKLAELAGVSQALVSNFVNGRKISTESEGRLTKVVPVSPADSCQIDGSEFAYCGSASCPSVCYAVVEGEVSAAPAFRPLVDLDRERCVYCRSLLYRECPACRAPIRDRSLVCPECEAPYVPVPDDLEGLPPNEAIRKCLLRNRLHEQIRRHLGEAT